MTDFLMAIYVGYQSSLTPIAKELLIAAGGGLAFCCSPGFGFPCDTVGNAIVTGFCLEGVSTSATGWLGGTDAGANSTGSWMPTFWKIYRYIPRI